MKVKFNSHYGQFAYEMSVSVEETELSPLAEMLIAQGLGNIAYRVAGSAVDKALGVKTGKGEAGRRGVNYSEEDAQKINAAVSKKLTELESAEGDKAIPAGISFNVTGEYTYGESGEVSRKRAEAFYAKAKADGKLGVMCELMLDGEVEEDDDEAEVVEVIHRKLFKTTK